MSSAKSAKMGSLSSTLVKDVVSLNPTRDTITTNDCNLLFPHSSHIPYTLSLRGAPLSICQFQSGKGQFCLSASSGLSYGSSPSPSNTSHQNHSHTQNSKCRVWVCHQGLQPSPSPYIDIIHHIIHHIISYYSTF